MYVAKKRMEHLVLHPLFIQPIYLNYAVAVSMFGLRRAIQKARANPVTSIQIAYKPGMAAMSLLFNREMVTVVDTVESVSMADDGNGVRSQGSAV